MLLTRNFNQSQKDSFGKAIVNCFGGEYRKLKFTFM